MESLVRDIPAGDEEIDNLFYSEISRMHDRNPGDDTNKSAPNFSKTCLESVSRCNNCSYLLYVPFDLFENNASIMYCTEQFDREKYN